MAKLKLYHYWRSSSSWRVRWAFSYKGIDHSLQAVDLLSGESESPEHLRRHPLGFVPVLEIETSQGPQFLTESIAMIHWAEEAFPQTPSLLPGDVLQRAKIRELTEIINADTQPLQNLPPQYLYSEDPEKRKAWAQHWIRNGLQAYEAICKRSAGRFSVGDSLTIADLCLIPQCYNATRFDVPIADYPTIARIHAEALKTPSYAASEPERFKPASMA